MKDNPPTAKDICEKMDREDPIGIKDPYMLQIAMCEGYIPPKGDE
jgi:hypothetical protein